MDLPPHHSIRAPTAHDLDAVADVMIASDIDATGRVVLDADFIQAGWNREGFDLATDAWVVVDASEVIVAYGHAAREGPDVVDSWGVVHPAHRGKGIGSALFDRIEQRSGQLLAGLPTRRFRHAIDAEDDGAAAMLRRRGMRPVRHFWHMGIDLDGSLEPRRVPEGVQLTEVEPDRDLRAVHAVLAEAFAEDWGYHPEPFERWVDEYMGDPSFDPALWLLARENEVPVGAITANLSGDRAWIGEVGVIASHRGRGIAAALLGRSFVTLQERGVGSAFLNVDAENPTGATALYERAGMWVARRWVLWERSSGDSP
jgi:mycothiol synthase